MVVVVSLPVRMVVRGTIMAHVGDAGIVVTGQAMRRDSIKTERHYGGGSCQAKRIERDK